MQTETDHRDTAHLARTKEHVPETQPHTTQTHKFLKMGVGISKEQRQ